MRKSILIILILYTSVSYCQTNFDTDISYIIKIREFKKGWIDAEYSYWLLETSKIENSLNIEFCNKSYVATNIPESYIIDWELRLCCKKDINFNEKISEQQVTNLENFFSDDKIYETKNGDFKISILAINQSNCKCPVTTLYENEKSNEPIALIFKYKSLKIGSKEKKCFRKNALIFINSLNLK